MATANVAIAQVTLTAHAIGTQTTGTQAAQATAIVLTSQAQSAKATAQYAESQTAVARTQAALETRIVRTQTAQDTAIARTQAVQETRDYRTAQAYDTATYKTAVALTVRTAQDEQRQRNWDEFWQGFFSTLGDVAQAVIWVIVIAGLTGAGLWLALTLYVRGRRGLVIEAGSGTLYLGWKPTSHPVVITKPTAQLLAEPEAPTGDAPALETGAVRFYTNGKLKAVITKHHNASERRLALKLLTDATVYVQSNPEWDASRIPGWRELGWTSAGQHSRALKVLGNAIVNEGGGKGGGVYVSKRFENVPDLLDAVCRRRITLG